MTSPFPGFNSVHVLANGVSLQAHLGGEGPPLVLLHGYPQTSFAWHKVVPHLARQFTCILFDLRGYGKSDAPHDPGDGSKYTKSVMAEDIIAAMNWLGHDTFHLAGHDRGARVAYRLALNHPTAVRKLAILEVIPTLDMWENFNAELAMKAYHWTFLAQPRPLPENMINADPVDYVDFTLASWSKTKDLSQFEEKALASYRQQFTSPTRVRAFCADYRAGATFDRAEDLASRQAGRKISAPLLFLYSKNGFPAKTGKPLSFWQNWAENVTGHEVDAGHFILEEAAESVSEHLLNHFKEP